MASGRLSKVKGKVVDIPTVPTVGTATAGGESASITFTASTKGGTASTYTALSNPGSVTGSAASSPVTVTGLTAGTAYTFTVRGNNSTGSSEYSSASNSITPTVATSYESISTVSVGSGGSTEIDFTSISGSYTHLQIRYLVRNTSDAYYLRMRCNSDTGSNYSWHILGGDGTDTYSLANASQTDMVLPRTSAPTVASVYTAGVIDVLDYANTNKYKTVRALGGYNSNNTTTGDQKIELNSGNWRNTNAITSIKLFVSSGTMAQYSSFALYGIKGA